MELEALVYSENELGKLDGKVTNGLVRHSEKYKIVGVIDSTKEGLDAGMYLDGKPNGIPVFKDIYTAIANLTDIPKYFIYGIAPLTPSLAKEDREVLFTAMKLGMDIVNGLPEFLSDDAVFTHLALESGVKIHDVRKPPARKDLHSFNGQIKNIKTPVVAVLGTDCAVGKRTTAVELVDALRASGLKVVFIATGQTGLLQGAKYGTPVDMLSSGFASGEVEHAIVTADAVEAPDVFIVEGQGSLSHPAFTSTSAIIRGSMPDAIILQHPPKRKTRCDFPDYEMPEIAQEIALLELYAQTKVVAITLNHEEMTEADIDLAIIQYEAEYQVPTTDVLKRGCEKLVSVINALLPQPIII